MKVLIFTNSSAKYDAAINSYHGAGWIESFITLLERQNEIELALAFFHSKDCKKVQRDNLTFYPIFKASRRSNPFKTIFDDLKGNIESESLCKDMVMAIEDFKPDVIQVFGSENIYPSVQKYTQVPVIVHLQGLLNPTLNSFYPVNQSKLNFLTNPDFFLQNLLGKGMIFTEKRIYNKAKRESEHFSSLDYVMGRTHWDKIVTHIHNPKIKYFHVNEVLRPVFYEYISKQVLREKKECIQITSTISPAIYKGIDVILKTAKLLKENSNLKFKWSIVGIDKANKLVRHFEKSLQLKHQDLNIEFLGIRKANDFIETILMSDLFIHPSYIDNSPNSVCEAQLLGVPVIACNVGGIATLINNGTTGRLVPSNGIYEFVHSILEFNSNPEIYWEMADTAKEIALKRHDRNIIMGQVFEVYKKIKKEEEL